jgi:hypothetical protein
MRVYKHWLDHDVAALAFLIVGIAAVELLAMLSNLLPRSGGARYFGQFRYFSCARRNRYEYLIL